MRVLNISVIMFLLTLTTQGYSQTIKFRDSDQKVEVYKGSQIEILTDTAFVISKSRAKLLNEKLTELQQTRESNIKLQSINQELLGKVKEVENLVSQLLVKMENNEEVLDLDLTEILTQLDASLVVLKENNQELAEHNKNLNQQIATLQTTIKTLKKEIRGIWWNGVTDKITVGVGALIVGFLIGSVS